MSPFLENLLTACIHGSIVILAVMLLRLLLRKTPKKYICLLWLLCGIRLLMPIKIRSELSLQPEFSLPPALVPHGALLWIWGFVVCCFGLYSFLSYRKLKEKVREAVRIRGGWECDRIDTAFILGFIKPRIYIPMGITGQARKHILEHERTHLDKGDHWIKMIGFLALALHWFNPLVWIAYALLCKDIEMACDERVVQFMELEERKVYSAALLSCSSKQFHFAASPVAFGEVSVKQRILSVLNYKKPGFWISLLGVVAFFFVAVCLLTAPPTPEAPPAQTLSAEEQARADLLANCREDVESALSREEFILEIITSNSNGNPLAQIRLYRLGADTIWTYAPSSRADITDGRMERSGKHYAWQSGHWVETDTADTQFEAWLDIFRWDAATAEYVAEENYEGASGLIFTSLWPGQDQTLHTATFTCGYLSDGTLQNVSVDQPNCDNADRAHLYLDPLCYESATVADHFLAADAAIAEGSVTQEELTLQAHFDSWGIYFRVDDDRLSSTGSDVYFAQDDYGFGTISTTEKYWLEKKIGDTWQTVPTITEPKWKEDGIGVAKGASTFGYLDWTPLYGQLDAGLYRMGKIFQCHDRDTNKSQQHTFYAEFQLFESVDSDSPEAKAAVERCYAELEELKQRSALHWMSVSGRDSTMEYWVVGEDFLKITHWFGPEYPQDEWSEHDKNLFPRVTTSLRYQGVGYETVPEDPEVLSGPVLGIGISTLEPTRAGWSRSTISDDFNMLFFERSNHTISFPEGIGIVSDETVRFQESWSLYGVEELATAILTYRFNAEGNLCYMEYQTDLGNGRDYISSIEI